jgi:hypothetical protein
MNSQHWKPFTPFCAHLHPFSCASTKSFILKNWGSIRLGTFQEDAREHIPSLKIDRSGNVPRMDLFLGSVGTIKKEEGKEWKGI